MKKRGERVFSPEWIRQQVEGNIDRVYAYLWGRTDGLVVKVDLEDRQDEARAAVAEVFKGMVSALPPCGAGVVGDYFEFDVFGAVCLPRNLDRAQIEGIIDNGVGKITPISTNLVEVEGIGVEKNLLPLVALVGVVWRVLLVAVAVVLLVGALVFGLIPGERNKVRVVVAVVGLSGMGLVVVGIVAPRVILKLVESRIAGQFGAEDMGLVGLWLSVVRVAVAELAYTVMGLGLVAILGAGLGWRMLVTKKVEGCY